METKQINGYTIKFYNEEEWYKEPYRLNDDTGSLKDYKYAGLVSNIPKELAEKIVDKDIYYGVSIYYRNYEYPRLNSLQTAKDSLQTLSNLPYCVITND